MIQQLLPAGVKIKELLADTQPPNNDLGTPMCLSFPLHGGCWSTCVQKEDHWPHMQGKQDLLATFKHTCTITWCWGKEVLNWPPKPLEPPTCPWLLKNQQYSYQWQWQLKGKHPSTWLTFNHPLTQCKLLGKWALQAERKLLALGWNTFSQEWQG